MPPTAPSRETNRTIVLALALVAVVAAVAVVLAVRKDDTPAPQQTVEAFLIAALVDNNGVEACDYLTQRAILEARAVGHRLHDGCHSMFDEAQLTLGGVPVTQERQIKRLHYSVHEDDRHAQVTVSGDGGSFVLLLRHATAEQVGEFAPPGTPWRIYSGVAPLLR
jgi:hypothetical protein